MRELTETIVSARPVPCFHLCTHENMDQGGSRQRYSCILLLRAIRDCRYSTTGAGQCEAAKRLLRCFAQITHHS